MKKETVLISILRKIERQKKGILFLIHQYLNRLSIELKKELI